MGVPVAPYPCLYLEFSVFLILSILVGESGISWWFSFPFLWSLLMMLNLFFCAYWSFVTLEMCKSFAFFKKKKKICLLISYYQVASVLDFYFDHKTFVRYSYHKYFLWVWSLHFHFMNGLFWRIPVFNFDEIQFIIFLWLMLLCPKKF